MAETITITSDARIIANEEVTIQSNAFIGYNEVSWKKIQSDMRNADTTPQTGGQGDGGFRIL